MEEDHELYSEAWVTLVTNDSYGLGALVLGSSLRRVATTRQTVVMVTPTVSQSMREELARVYTRVVQVDVLDSGDAANLALMARPELGVTFTKLHAWTLVDYTKCVFLDADTLLIQNSDELFEREELSAAPDPGWPDCFNSGVFVFVPNMVTYQALLDFAVAHGSFDGGDQGLLNMFFSGWAVQDIKKHLPFSYNLVASTAYTYLPALKFFGSQVKIVHFLGGSKPWTKQAEASSLPYQRAWWSIFREDVSPHLNKEMILCSSLTGSEKETSADSRHKFRDPWTSWKPEPDLHQASIVPSERHTDDPLTMDRLSTVPHDPQTSQPDPTHSTDTSTGLLLTQENSSHHDQNLNKDTIILKIQNNYGRSQNLKSKHQMNNKNIYYSSTNKMIENFPSLLINNKSENDKAYIFIKGNVNTSQITALLEEDIEFTLETDKDLTMNVNNQTKRIPKPCFLHDSHSSKGECSLTGVAGALARGDTEEWRKEAWESGDVDYLGRDSFDNIWQRICESVGIASAKTKETTQVQPAAETSAKPVEQIKEGTTTQQAETTVQPSVPADGASQPCVQGEAVSQPAVSQETSLQESAPQLVTSQDSAPQPAVPLESVPLPAVPSESVPLPAVPLETTAQPAPPQETVPQPATSQEAVPEIATSQEATSVSVKPQEATPLPVTPQEATPAPATPQEATPLPATPQEVTPLPATPQEATPLPATPQEVKPLPSTPQESTPLPATPEDASPNLLPQLAVLSEVTPQPTIPTEDIIKPGTHTESAPVSSEAPPSDSPAQPSESSPQTSVPAETSSQPPASMEGVSQPVVPQSKGPENEGAKSDEISIQSAEQTHAIVPSTPDDTTVTIAPAPGTLHQPTKSTLQPTASPDTSSQVAQTETTAVPSHISTETSEALVQPADSTPQHDIPVQPQSTPDDSKPQAQSAAVETSPDVRSEADKVCCRKPEACSKPTPLPEQSNEPVCPKLVKKPKETPMLPETPSDAPSPAQLESEGAVCPVEPGTPTITPPSGPGSPVVPDIPEVCKLQATSSQPSTPPVPESEGSEPPVPPKRKQAKNGKPVPKGGKK